MKWALLRCSKDINSELMIKRMKDWEGKNNEEYLWENGGIGVKFETKPFVVSWGGGHPAASVQNLISWPYFCSVGVRGEDWGWIGMNVLLGWRYFFDVQERRNGWEGTIRVGWGLSIVVVIVMWVSSWWLWERKKERLTWKL